MYSYESLKDEYLNLYDTAVITDAAAVASVAKIILANRSRYETVGAELGIPWYFIGIIHMLESSCNFKTHLHNGDPLTARTKRVPAGRPKAGSPPFTWEVSAKDALVYEGFSGQPIWTLPVMLYRFEAYNGFGYRKLKSAKCMTPYLWSRTNHYTKGKFVEEKDAAGKWRSSFKKDVVSKQVGAAAVLMHLQLNKQITIAR